MKIECINISIGSGEELYIKEFSKIFEKGKHYWFSGGCGQGKTLLFYSIAGIRLPFKGDVKLDDRSFFFTASFLKPELKRHIGIVNQIPVLLSNQTIGKNFELISKIKGVPLKEYIRKMHEFKLGDVLQRRPVVLSHGELKILNIIAALLHKPDFIFWDSFNQIKDTEHYERIKSWVFELTKNGSSLVFFDEVVPSLEMDWEEYKVERIAA